MSGDAYQHEYNTMLAALRRMARYPCNGSKPDHMPQPNCENREVFCIGAVPCFPCWALQVVRGFGPAALPHKSRPEAE